MFEKVAGLPQLLLPEQEPVNVSRILSLDSVRLIQESLGLEETKNMWQFDNEEMNFKFFCPNSFLGCGCLQKSIIIHQICSNGVLYTDLIPCVLMFVIYVMNFHKKYLID